MNAQEALEQLQQGKKLKRPDWGIHPYIELVEGGQIRLHAGTTYPAQEYLEGHEWELKEEND